MCASILIPTIWSVRYLYFFFTSITHQSTPGRREERAADKTCPSYLQPTQCNQPTQCFHNGDKECSFLVIVFHHHNIEGIKMWIVFKMLPELPEACLQGSGSLLAGSRQQNASLKFASNLVHRGRWSLCRAHLERKKSLKWITTYKCGDVSYSILQRINTPQQGRLKLCKVEGEFENVSYFIFFRAIAPTNNSD